MKAIVCDLVPRSIQARSKAAFQQALGLIWDHLHGGGVPLAQDCYGLVYYFHRNVSGLDADNISKPIWDALNARAFVDDRLVRLRQAGMIRNEAAYTNVLDLTDMPDEVVEEFLRLLDSSDHVLYIEVGTLSPDHYRVGLEV